MRKLGIVLLLPLCLGFEWPGRITRLKYEQTHGEPAQRQAAVRQLGHYAADDVRESLLAALDDDDASVRVAAVTALGELRIKDALPVLVDWADEQDAALRSAVVRALGRMDDARARPPVVRALADAKPDVRSSACAALGSLGGAESVTALLTALEDLDGRVRLAAIEALRGNADARAFAGLALRTRDDLPEVRAAALTALSELHEPRALALLTQGLSDGEGDVRVAAAMALGTLGDPGAVEPLLAALGREPRASRAVVSALARIDDAHVEGALVAALAEPELAASARTALVERVRRQAAATDALLSALAAKLRENREPATTNAIAETLIELSQLASIEAATDALVFALREGTGDAGVLAHALSLTGSETALVPLLETLETLDEARLVTVLDAMIVAAHGPLDGRAADPLAARLARSKGAAKHALVRALGKTRAKRVAPALLPLIAADDRALRLAAIFALAEIGGEDVSAALHPLLADRDAEVRHAAGLALGASASVADVRTLLETLRSPEPRDRHALLGALSLSLPRLARTRALDESTARLATDTLEAFIVSEDDALADRALDALRRFAPTGGAEAVARLWRTPSSRRRAAAARALSAWPGDETRKLLRFMLRQPSSPEVTVAIVASLGEVGDKRDAAALLSLGERRHWPVPGAAAYALARLAERGELKKHSTQRSLCGLLRSREPYVRANVITAMAAMGADACDDTLHPLRFLDPGNAVAVRIAAARWARAAAAADALPKPLVEARLRECSADTDPAVSAACVRALRAGRATPGEPALQAQSDAELVDVYAYAADGATELVHRLIALRSPSGSVFVGYTDGNAHVLLPTGTPDELVLEDPASAQLDP